MINLLLVVILAAIWIVFAPQQVGGQVAYVIVNGISMEPGFHKGDLAIVITAPVYDVGDIVTYRDIQMNSYVIHRIIGMEQDHFMLKGDNNSWIDSYRPNQGEIIGKLWIHIPQFGKTMEWLRSPINMTMAAALVGGTLMASIYLEPGKTAKNKKKKSGGRINGILEPAMYTLGVLVLAFVVLCIYAFNQPLAVPADDIKYKQTGAFSYTASTVPGIYDQNLVSSGDPIFPKLNCAITVGFLYKLTGGLDTAVGTQSLTASIQDEGSGWKRSIPLTRMMPFNGDSFSTSADLDLCQVQALIDDVENKTGFRANSYTLTINSHVNMVGSTAGQILQDTFDAKLGFQFDKLHFSMIKNSVASVDPMTSSKDSQVKSTTTRSNTLPILGHTFAVFDLRVAGLIGLALALVDSLLAGWAVFRVAKQDTEAYNRLRYGALVIDVHAQALERLFNLIDVASLEDLAKLAERQNSMIFHATRGNNHTYFVQSDGSSYRYTETVAASKQSEQSKNQPKGGL